MFKSSKAELRKRGMPSPEDISLFAELPSKELTVLLQDEDACRRSAAAVCLEAHVNQAADKLLAQLATEECLYTRIAICETLEKGNVETAGKMAEYLGQIGNNQYLQPPDKVSAKKSFPLPRDIIARSLGRMDISVFPLLLQVVEGDSSSKVSEVLDAIGYMAFYHNSLAEVINCKAVLAAADRYKEHPCILWKVIRCLSGFPLEESRNFLISRLEDKTIYGMEARRSLRLIEEHTVCAGCD